MLTFIIEGISGFQLKVNENKVQRLFPSKFMVPWVLSTGDPLGISTNPRFRIPGKDLDTTSKGKGMPSPIKCCSSFRGCLKTPTNVRYKMQPHQAELCNCAALLPFKFMIERGSKELLKHGSQGMRSHTLMSAASHIVPSQNLWSVCTDQLEMYSRKHNFSK